MKAVIICCCNFPSCAYVCTTCEPGCQQDVQTILWGSNAGNWVSHRCCEWGRGCRALSSAHWEIVRREAGLMSARLQEGLAGA